MVTRDRVKGPQVVRVDRTASPAARSRVCALGELWVSYADGHLEAPMISGE